MCVCWIQIIIFSLYALFLPSEILFSHIPLLIKSLFWTPKKINFYSYKNEKQNQKKKQTFSFRSLSWKTKFWDSKRSNRKKKLKRLPPPTKKNSLFQLSFSLTPFLLLQIYICFVKFHQLKFIFFSNRKGGQTSFNFLKFY